uniref:30S ribosomal protein S7 n=1 Tax=Nephromyces sp. ex Molgula occidentalis TaxID=2544991 RepID=A0A5C1H7X3_9APIC|nr:30S ribosomal protein S7 [Nephromyces sp. ex Molgula occidentalis]
MGLKNKILKVGVIDYNNLIKWFINKLQQNGNKNRSKKIVCNILKLLTQDKKNSKLALETVFYKIKIPNLKFNLSKQSNQFSFTNDTCFEKSLLVGMSLLKNQIKSPKYTQNLFKEIWQILLNKGSILYYKEQILKQALVT